MPSFPFLSSVEEEHELEEDTKERECIECDDTFFLTSGEIDFISLREVETSFIEKGYSEELNI